MKQKYTFKLSKKLLAPIVLTAPFSLVAVVSCNATSTVLNDEALLKLVTSKVEVKTVQNINRTYSVFYNNQELEFQSLAETHNFLSQTQLKKASYDKLPGFNFYPTSTEVDETNIIASSVNLQVKSFKKADGTFTYAFTNDEISISKARHVAALSYIQVHNGYQYNDYLFDNFNDVESFVRSLSDVELQNLINGQATNRQIVRFENGIVRSFDHFDEIKHTLAANATPYYKDAWGSLTSINSSNVHQIASGMAEDDLAFIPISSNGGKGTQLVDMDATTPNGQLYGPYLLQSGIGLDGVYDPLNWKPLTPNSQVTSYQETYDEQILNAYVSNLILKQGVMFDVFVMNHKISLNDNSLSLIEFLETISSSFNYASALQTFFSTIIQGTRYTALNSIILARAFLMDKMIQNKEDTNKIIYLSKFFQAMAHTLDIYNTAELAPFLVGAPKLDASGNVIPNESIKISYFADTLAFDTEGDFNNYAFQTDPGYYYRKLIGLDDKFKPENAQNNSAVFKLVHASFGPLLMMDKEVENIKTAYDQSVKRVKDTLAANGKTVPSVARAEAFKLKFDYAPRTDIFVGQEAASDQSQEYELIWSLLNDTLLKGALGYQTYDTTSKTWVDKTASGSAMRTNYSNFLVQSQNQILTRFVNELKTDINKVNKDVEDGKFAFYEDIWKTEAAKELLSTSIATFMASRISLVVENLPQTLKQRQAALQSSIEGLLPSADDKWMSFSGNFLLPMFNVTTSVVVASQVALAFVKSKIAAQKRKTALDVANNSVQTQTDDDPLVPPSEIDLSEKTLLKSVSWKFGESPIELDNHNLKMLLRYDKKPEGSREGPINDQFLETFYQPYKVPKYYRSNRVPQGAADAFDEIYLVSDPFLPQYINRSSREKFLFDNGFTLDDFKDAFFGNPKSPYFFPKKYDEMDTTNKQKFQEYIKTLGLDDEIFYVTKNFYNFDAVLQTKITNREIVGIDYNNQTKVIDPVVHYYETLRNTMGVILLASEGKQFGAPLSTIDPRDFHNLHQKIFGFKYTALNLNPPSLVNESRPLTPVIDFVAPVELKKAKAYQDETTGSKLINFIKDHNPFTKKAQPTNSSKPKKIIVTVEGVDFEVEVRHAERYNDQSRGFRATTTKLAQGLSARVNLIRSKFKTITKTETPQLQIDAKQTSWLQRFKNWWFEKRNRQTPTDRMREHTGSFRDASVRDFVIVPDILPPDLNADLDEGNLGNVTIDNILNPKASLTFQKALDQSTQTGDDASDGLALSQAVKTNSVKASAALNYLQGAAFTSVAFSSLLGIAAALSQMIASYESTEVIPYEFKTREGVSLYWDGTRITTKMWGLYSTINFNIKDLKMLTTSVISGYTANEEGVYHNGKFYKDTNTIRFMQANTLVQQLSQTNQIDESFWKVEIPNVVWKIDLVDWSDNLTFNTISQLLDHVQNSALLSASTFDKVYRLVDHKVTSSESFVVDDIVKTLRQTLRPSLIFKLPEINDDDKLERGRFQLPEPYYSNGRRFDKPPISDQVAYEKWMKRKASYIIYNQSINEEWLNLEASKNVAERDILYDYFERIFQTNLDQAYEAILASHLDKLMLVEKNTSLNEVLNTNQFDELNDLTSQSPIDLYSLVDKHGKARYFASEDEAIRVLQTNQNMMIFQNDNQSFKTVYVYNNQTFNSLQDIVNLLLKNKESRF